MRKLFALGIGLLLFVSCEQDTTVSENEGVNVAQSSLIIKVDVCHKGRVINVSVNALGGHQGHGDAVDIDGDGYFDIENDCSETDCDDSNAQVNPAIEEVCGNSIDDNCNGEVDENCGPAIGDLVEGGVVFYIAPIPTDLDGDGILDTGLVCALEDYGTRVQWGCAGTNLPSVPDVTIGDPIGPGAEIGDGMSNTNGILATTDCPSAPAALAARSFGPEWFLPSILELNEIYVNRETLDAVAGFSPLQEVQGLYWSSTEYDDNSAWVIIYSFGILNITSKNDPFWIVRAVRAF